MGRSQRHKAAVQYMFSDGRLPPYALTKPTVAGTVTVGQVLTGTNGTFRGDPVPTVTREWYRDDVPISGQSAATYTLVTADKTHRIYFANVASSTRGITRSYSNPTVVVP